MAHWNPTPPLAPNRRITKGLCRPPRQTILRPDIKPSESSSRLKVCSTSALTIGSIRRHQPSLCQVSLFLQCMDYALRRKVIGSPARWLDRPIPFTVAPDSSGIVFVDQNGFRMESMPLLPLIKAVDTMSQTTQGAIRSRLALCRFCDGSRQSEETNEVD